MGSAIMGAAATARNPGFENDRDVGQLDSTGMARA